MSEIRGAATMLHMTIILAFYKLGCSQDVADLSREELYHLVTEPKFLLEESGGIDLVLVLLVRYRHVDFVARELAQPFIPTSTQP